MATSAERNKVMTKCWQRYLKLNRVALERSLQQHLEEHPEEIMENVDRQRYLQREAAREFKGLTRLMQIDVCELASQLPENEPWCRTTDSNEAASQEQQPRCLNADLNTAGDIHTDIASSRNEAAVSQLHLNPPEIPLEIPVRRADAVLLSTAAAAAAAPISASSASEPYWLQFYRQDPNWGAACAKADEGC